MHFDRVMTNLRCVEGVDATVASVERAGIVGDLEELVGSGGWLLRCGGEL